MNRLQQLPARMIIPEDKFFKSYQINKEFNQSVKEGIFDQTVKQVNIMDCKDPSANPKNEEHDPNDLDFHN